VLQVGADRRGLLAGVSESANGRLSLKEAVPDRLHLRLFVFDLAPKRPLLLSDLLQNLIQALIIRGQ